MLRRFAHLNSSYRFLENPVTQGEFALRLEFSPSMDLVIFDLDGTLIDSKLDLAHAVNATRAHMGLPPLEHELIYSYVGNGAPVLMRRSLGPEASEADVKRALDFFLAYYR